MENLSLNLLFEIFGYYPQILHTVKILSRTMDSRLLKSIGHLQTLLEEVLNVEGTRELDFEE